MVSESTSLYEKLLKAVRNYPCLYDKSSDDLKDANKKIFAEKSQKRLVLVVILKARPLFTNLRNKYSHDKMKIESKKVSGADTSEVTQAVKEASEIYLF